VGNLLKRKARCVVKGFKMIQGEHYYETFAAVVRYESVRMLLAVAASRGLNLHLVNMIGAFLNAKPQGEIYLEIPPGFKSHYAIPGVDTILRLNQNLYGTMDGANNWARHLNNTFTQLGHRQSRADPCMHIQYTKDGGYTISATYTDNITTASSTDKAEEQTVRVISDKYEVTDHRKPKVILGIGVIMHNNGDISIHQKALILEALRDFGMADCNPKHTPLPVSVDLTNSQPMPIPEEDHRFMQDKDYRGGCGRLNHITSGTRHDAAHAAMVLMQYASDPRPIHWRLLLHVLAYLKATMNLGIRYKCNTDFKPVGFSDSSYADDPESRRSSAG